MAIGASSRLAWHIPRRRGETDVARRIGRAGRRRSGGGEPERPHGVVLRQPKAPLSGGRTLNPGAALASCFHEAGRPVSDRKRGWLTMHWAMPSGADSAEQRRARLRAMTRGYAGHRYFFPATAGLPRDLHPLMAWWVVLYVLSMLARYQPAQWAKHIDIDGSRHAVPIEKILERALEQLPTLIADAIEEVAVWP
ncbi:YaaC family protein [Streptomyces sp. NPDC088252]|uniref:YaaC family protein n=1 Tax=Streptomyces sp. NPDC088252 TaxID=3365845 RepID=UPI00381F4ABB